MGKTFEKLESLIKKELGNDIEVTLIKSLRPSYWQREKGGWSWMAFTSIAVVGSSQPATELLKCKEIKLERVGVDIEFIGIL